MLRLKFILYAVILALSGGICETSASGRIFGGDLVDIKRFPYIVSLQLKYRSTLPTLQRRHFCGGVIITSRFIITAAHCVDDMTKEEFCIKAGTTNLKKGGISKQIEEIIIHPKWNKMSKNFDFALLKLEKPLKFTNTISYVKLPQFSTKIPIKFGTAAGWGFTNNRWDDPDYLRAVDLKIINKCIEVASKKITEAMFCAGHSSRDTCRGDSGGPFVSDGVLYGIVSFGDGAPCNAAHTGVYAKVAYVRNWIMTNINDF